MNAGLRLRSTVDLRQLLELESDTPHECPAGGVIKPKDRRDRAGKTETRNDRGVLVEQVGYGEEGFVFIPFTETVARGDIGVPASGYIVVVDIHPIDKG